MEAMLLTSTTGHTFCLFDERGRLIGTIHRPLSSDPVGPGREKVYLERPSVELRQPYAA